jgi:hypothetical protein
VKKKRQELWKKKSWILLQDNEPAHNAFALKQILADKYNPDLKPPPFTVFSPLLLLRVPQTVKYFERNSFSVCRGEIKNGGPAEQGVS